MDDALGMRVGECFADLAHDFDGLGHIEPAFGDQAAQRAAIDMLHDEIKMSRRRNAGLKQRDDAWMPQFGQSACFTTKSLHEMLVPAGDEWQQLHRDEAVEFRLPHLIHHAHAAAPEHAPHFPLRKKHRDLLHRRRLPVR